MGTSGRRLSQVRSRSVKVRHPGPTEGPPAKEWGLGTIVIVD